MILVPVILNAINFWLIDNILKFNPEDSHEAKIVADVYSKEEEKEKRSISKITNSKLKNGIHHEVIVVDTLNNINNQF